MSDKNRDYYKIIAVVPALIGVLTATASIVIDSRAAEGAFNKIVYFFSNPLNAGAAALYVSVILAITTAIIHQLVSSLRSASQPSRGETNLAPESPPDVTELPPPQTPEEKASRERERQISSIRIAFNRNRRRMIDEADRMKRTGFLNLTIGILFSIIALGILGYPLVTVNFAQPTDWYSIFERIAPRFSVGILIQLIGFFFLRLYVTGENEINYIRNEITNIEARYISYNMASSLKDNTALRDIIKQLVRTERNFKLRKGERSLYETDEKFNDIRQVLGDLAQGVRRKTPG